MGYSPINQPNSSNPRIKTPGASGLGFSETPICNHPDFWPHEASQELAAYTGLYTQQPRKHVGCGALPGTSG